MLHLHVVHETVVYGFEADGTVLQDLGYVVSSLVDRRIAEHHKRPGRRAVDEPHLRLQDRGERAFAADQGAGDVEAFFGEEVVEVVAGDAAGDVRVAVPDQAGVLVPEVF